MHILYLGDHNKMTGESMRAGNPSQTMKQQLAMTMLSYRGKGKMMVATVTDGGRRHSMAMTMGTVNKTIQEV